MKRTASTRITTVLLTPLVAASIAAGAWTLVSTHPEYLADFGANDTAEIGQERARDAGVRHEHNGGHEHAPGLASAAGEVAF